MLLGDVWHQRCSIVRGDHLSFTANFQPSLIAAVMGGKLVAGICAIVFAFLLAVKKAEELEAEDRAAGLLGSDESQGNVAVDYYQDV